MQQNKTYAKILESQGFFEEAFVIYKKLLKQNPEDEEIKTALKRLKKIRIIWSQDGLPENVKTAEYAYAFLTWEYPPLWASMYALF